MVTKKKQRETSRRLDPAFAHGLWLRHMEKNAEAEHHQDKQHNVKC